MDKNLFIATLFVALAILVTLSHEDSAGNDPGDSNSYTDGALCQEIPVVLIHNSTDGVQVAVSSSIITETAPRADQANEQITTISGEYIPDECGPRHKRCNLVVIPYFTQVFALFPVRKGIVIVEYNRTTLDYANYFVVKTSAEDCTPTAIFFTGPDNGYSLFTACVNLSSDGNSYLQFLRFSFDGSDITTALFHDPSGSEQIYDPDTLSEFVYVRNQGEGGCAPSSADNVYVLDEGYVIMFSVDEWQFFYPEDRGCSSYQSVEYYGDNLLLMRCSNGTVLTFDTCRGRFASYYDASQSGLPYPCSNWGTVAVVRGGNLTFNTSAASNISSATNISLPPGDVQNAQCIDDGGDSVLFVFTVEGTVYTFSTLDDVLLELVPHSCNSSACLEPIVLTTESGSVVGAYDQESSHFLVVNTTCRVNPVVLKFPSFQPDLAAMFLGRRQFPCQCEPPSTPPTTATTQILPTETEEQPVPTSDSATPNGSTGSTSESTPVVDGPDLQVTTPVAAAAAAGAFFCFIAAVVVLVAAAVRRYHRQGNDQINRDRESRGMLRQSFDLLPGSGRVEQVEVAATNYDYGVLLDHTTVTPEAVTDHGDTDVAGMNYPPMPPEQYHHTSVAEMDQHRCSNAQKTNDFRRKGIEFENDRIRE